jgi:hypothetical protein
VFRLLDLIADGELLPIEDAPALRWRDAQEQPPGPPAVT